MANIENDKSKKASENRMNKLEKAIVKTVETALAKKDGFFTIFEINAVFNKVGYHFTCRGLDSQYLEAEPPIEGENKNVRKLDPKGNA